MFRKRKKETEEIPEEVESQEIEYTLEELGTIQDLLADFNEAPGQVAVPVDEEASGEEGAEEGADEGISKPPQVNLGEGLDGIDDLTGDIDNLGDDLDAAPPGSLVTEDGDQLADIDADFGIGEPGEPGAPGEAPKGESGEPETDDIDFDMDAGLLDEIETDTETQPDTPTSEADLQLDDLGISDADLGLDGIDGLDADIGGAGDLGLGDLGGDETEPQASLDELGDELGDEFGADLGDDLGADLGATDEADLGGLGDLGADLGDDLGADLGADLGGEAGEKKDEDDLGLGFDEAEQFESGGISLDDVSPEIAIGKGRGDDLDLTSELSDLSQEHSREEAMPSETLDVLRKNLRQFSPLLRQAVIDTILGKRLDEGGTSELINKIVSGEPEKEIQEFLETGLGAKLDEAVQEPEADRKLIVSREQYTEKGLERQAKLIKWTRFAAIAALVVAVVGSIGYQFVYKNIMYNRNIKLGKEALMAEPIGAPEIETAEKHFSEAIGYFPDRYRAYLQFAEAYRKRGLYEDAFEKLFGKVSMLSRKEALRYQNVEVDSPQKIWSLFTKVPVVSYSEESEDIVLINSIPWRLEKKGAYLMTHLDRKKDEAVVLYALGQFHSSPARRFHESAYRNNRLGIDYYQRILNFDPKMPIFGRDNYLSKAVMGIGEVYYNQKNYYKAHDYFEKIMQNDPKDVGGQAGMMRTLIQIYRETNDPRLIIQQHSMIRHNLKIERKLPMYILAKLAAFYIDLPAGEDLRISYNVSPIDKVNGQDLKSRAGDLLNSIYNKDEKDTYGNSISGETYAEGFYQRGRYFRDVTGEIRMAMMQFEYAYKYNPGHFLALNDRAEILMDLHDYEGAMQHLKMAEKEISEARLNLLGDLPEHETLLEADLGKIYLNMAKALYLSTVKGLHNADDWLRIQETSKFETGSEHGREALAAMLDRTDTYFDKAEEIGVRDKGAQAELAYYRGWSYYIRNNYNKALLYWQSIDPSLEKDHPNLELAKSYALYYLAVADSSKRKQYLESALSHLFFLQSEMAPQTELVGTARRSNTQHMVLFSRLAIIENNIGAIYEMVGNEELAIKHYWKSIEYSRQIEQENEIAQLNIRLSFKRGGLELDERYPVIMDFISPLMSDKAL